MTGSCWNDGVGDIDVTVPVALYLNYCQKGFVLSYVYNSATQTHLIRLQVTVDNLSGVYIAQSRGNVPHKVGEGDVIVLLQYVSQCLTVGQLGDHPDVFGGLVPLVEHNTIINSQPRISLKQYQHEDMAVVEIMHQTNKALVVKYPFQNDSSPIVTLKPQQ